MYRLLGLVGPAIISLQYCTTAYFVVWFGAAVVDRDMYLALTSAFCCSVLYAGLDAARRLWFQWFARYLRSKIEGKKER